MRFLRKLFRGPADRGAFFLFSLFFLQFSLVEAFLLVYFGNVSVGSNPPWTILLDWTIWTTLLEHPPFFYLLLPFFLIPLASRRLYAIGWSRWFSVLIIIPLVNILAMAILSVIPGRKDMEGHMKLFQGHIDRKTFFIYSLFLLALPWLNIGFYLYLGSVMPVNSLPSWSLWISFLVITFFSPFLLVPLAVRRLRHIGRLRWFITAPLVVLVAAPVINLGTTLILSLIPGKGDADHSWFGRHPFRSIGVFLLVLIISFVCFVTFFKMSRCKGGYDPETGDFLLCLLG